MKHTKPVIIIVAKTKGEAINYYKKLMNNKNTEHNNDNSHIIFDHPMYKVCFLEEYSIGKGYRCCFVYARKEVIQSEWFKSVYARAMFGVETID